MKMSEPWVTKVQDKLFDDEGKPAEAGDWENMPEFVNEKNDAYRKIIISFDKEEDVQDFARVLGQNITDKTKSLWWPAKRKDNDIMMWADDS